MIKRMKSISFSRYLVYTLGMIILAFGITLNTKTQLGISPIISVPYCIAQIASINLGLFVFVYYGFLILLQFIIYKGKMEIFQILQIAAALITSLFIDVFDRMLPNGSTLPSRYIMLAAAVIITGFGASLTVGMKIVPNPADGLANAFGFLLRKDLGFGKNALDLSCIAVTAAISLLFAGHFIGIGVGTVITMIFTGRVVALCRKPVQSLYQKLSRETSEETD